MNLATAGSSNTFSVGVIGTRCLFHEGHGGNTDNCISIEVSKEEVKRIERKVNGSRR